MCKNFVEKPEVKMRMAVKETGCEGVDWINLAQNRDTLGGIVNAVMNLQVP
jgi:hypothetical protein